MMRGEEQTKNATADHGARGILSAVRGSITGLGASMRRATHMFSDAFLWAFRGIVAGNRFSSLTRRIVVFQVVALLVLVAGVLYLNQFRQGLIDARKQALLVQAEIIAGAVAETAVGTLEAEVIDPLAELEKRDQWVDPDLQFQDRDVPISATAAAPVLRRLILPTQTRARLYDKDGWLILDSRQLTASGQIVAFELPPVGGAEDQSWTVQAMAWLRSLAPGPNYERYLEAGSQNGRIYDEVSLALGGFSATMERMNDRSELIVSVAVPVQRFRAVLGVLMLSTEGGDIDAIVQAERLAIVEVFLIALGVAILLSVVLAGTIAEPVRRLAETAERVSQGVTERVEIPDFTDRRDEIGDLSGALRGMTDALYGRIDAIEAFAADVAHELKNPLTSVRSAVETLSIVKDDTAREKLMGIIQHDIRRIDRLISDISEASRLDAELSREELVPFNVVNLAETIVDLFNTTGTKDGKSVRLEVQDVADRRAFDSRGTDSRIGQVLRNLIDNALSFSPESGEVTLQVARIGDSVLVTVEDEGPGVPEDSLEKIFERFHTDREGEFGRHSGLGLSISKQIVLAHRGTIYAENRDEGGARFVVELPAARTHDTKAIPRETSKPSKET
ncbi:sensor histidine kinase [Parvibaculaceae bacterium PLY_AMNH_Bact1]|nr:sensor histidine kinase [Parvibaculaceae bacterium PLY_AMNH_Bact1]